MHRRQPPLAVLELGVGIVAALDVGPQEAGERDDLAGGLEVGVGARRPGPEPTGAASRTVALVPVASAIWLATVRCQISSYSRNSSPLSWPAIWPGVRKVSPAGRMASWASWAFLTLRA